MIQFVFPKAGKDFVFVMITVFVSLFIGGVIGEAIGKMRGYKANNSKTAGKSLFICEVNIDWLGD